MIFNSFMIPLKAPRPRAATPGRPRLARFSRLIFFIVFLSPGGPAWANPETGPQLALKSQLIDLKTGFESKTSQTKDPEKLMLEGLRATAQAWALAAEFLAAKANDAAVEKELAKARADFAKAWAAGSNLENRMLIASELYYKAVAAVAALSAKEQNNLLALGRLESLAGEVASELAGSVYDQRKATVYINALARGVMPLLVKLKTSPKTQILLDQETSRALKEAEFLASRTDVHLRGKFFILYSSSARLLLKSSFLLAEDPNLRLTEDLAPVKAVWQNADTGQNDPAGLALTMGALALTTLPLAYGVASQ